MQAIIDSRFILENTNCFWKAWVYFILKSLTFFSFSRSQNGAGSETTKRQIALVEKKFPKRSPLPCKYKQEFRTKQGDNFSSMETADVAESNLTGLAAEVEAENMTSRSTASKIDSEAVIDAMWTIGFTVIVIGGILGNGIVFWIIVGNCKYAQDFLWGKYE